MNSAGHDAVHWSGVGRDDASDAGILLWAAENGSVVLTNDLDFGTILAGSSSRHPSVIQLRSENLRPSQVGVAVLTAVAASQIELAEGALLTLDAARSRLRILPLTSIPER